MNKIETMEAAARGEGCLGRSKDDEPVFVLCARDEFAPATIRRWARLVEESITRSGRRRMKIVGARMIAGEMERWRKMDIPRKAAEEDQRTNESELIVELMTALKALVYRRGLWHEDFPLYCDDCAAWARKVLETLGVKYRDEALPAKPNAHATRQIRIDE